MSKIKPIKFKSIKEIEEALNSKEFKDGIKLIVERNKKLIEDTKIDWTSLHRPFDI